jgi:hypothetical protein
VRIYCTALHYTVRLCKYIRTCNEQNSAGTFSPSKNISAAFSLLDVGFRGASVRRTWGTCGVRSG